MQTVKAVLPEKQTRTNSFTFHY